MPVSVCILSCIALPVRAMDAPTSPSRWGRFALEHRPARLLCQACSEWPSSRRLGPIRLQLAFSATLSARYRHGSSDFFSGQAG